jgi:hypothetical protein
MSDEDRRIVKEEIIPYWKGEGDWKRHCFTRTIRRFRRSRANSSTAIPIRS